MRHPVACLPSEKGLPWSPILPSRCQKPQIIKWQEKPNNVSDVMMERGTCSGTRMGSLEGGVCPAYQEGEPQMAFPRGTDQEPVYCVLAEAGGLGKTQV